MRFFANISFIISGDILLAASSPVQAPDTPFLATVLLRHIYKLRC